MQRGRILFGILSVGLVLLLNLLAAAPSLHEWFHADAGHEDHQCAVTMFAHGQVDSATVEVFAVKSVILFESVPETSFSIFAPAIENLPAGRAPPVSVSSLS